MRWNEVSVFGARGSGEHRIRYLRDNLVPVADRLEFVFEVTAEISIQLLFGDQLEQIRVETHLYKK